MLSPIIYTDSNSSTKPIRSRSKNLGAKRKKKREAELALDGWRKWHDFFFNHSQPIKPGQAKANANYFHTQIKAVLISYYLNVGFHCSVLIRYIVWFLFRLLHDGNFVLWTPLHSNLKYCYKLVGSQHSMRLPPQGWIATPKVFNLGVFKQNDSPSD